MNAFTLNLESLRATPLLSSVSAEALAEIAPHVSGRRFSSGERILSAGDYCDGAYYLVKGSVAITFPSRDPSGDVAEPVESPAAKRGRLRSFFSRSKSQAAPDVKREASRLAESPVDLKPGETVTLEAGDVFGEGSALSRFPIATNITAASNVTALFIRTAGLRLMFDQPELESFKAIFDQRYRERTLRAHLGRVDLFKALDAAGLAELAERAELVTFKPGKVIVEEGKKGEAIFLVRAGYVEVGSRLGEADVTVTYLRRGDWVGETSLLLRQPWPFTLTAVEHVELVKISHTDIRALLAKFPEAERDVRRSMMARLKEIGYQKAHPQATETLQFSMDSGLIHGESVLLINLETCTRCDECVRACADTHEGIPRFVREGIKFHNFTVTTACYHCTDPVCMIGCPTGAITRPLGTFEVAIDKHTCIGCGNCVKRCPWGNIRAVPYDVPGGERINLATKCDLCIGRAEGPACVQMCPQGSAMRVNFKQLERVDELLSR